MKLPRTTSDHVIGMGYKRNYMFTHGLTDIQTPTEHIYNGFTPSIETSSDIYGDDIEHGLSDSPTPAGPEGLSLQEDGAGRRGSHVVDVREVTYTVKEWQGSWWKGCCFRTRRDKAVLSDVNMQFRSGQLTAVLGNSGSGKTSLLDILAKRHSGDLQGRVLYDGQPLTENMFRKHAGYVIQADRLLANLTVRETLMYTARLKFTARESHRVIKDRVSQVLTDMGLGHVAGSKVGGHIVRGISGGERRRVSIAVQLLQDPSLLLLDEPTTGLDSFTAHHLVSTLARLAHCSHRVILMSIHQPRSDIFTLFDQIGILSQGQVIYFGPRADLVPHFTKLGHPCPTYANPLDHYVDLASIDRRDVTSESMSSNRVRQLRQDYLASDVYTELEANMRLSASQTPRQPGKDPHREADSKHTPQCARFFPLFDVLIRRMYLNLWRDRSGLVGRIIMFPVFAMFVWLFLWQLRPDFSTAIQDRTGVLFETVSAASIMGLLNAIALFPAHQDLYWREAREGLYGCAHMLTAYFLHILPFSILASLIYATWCYWGVGLYPEADRFCIFFAVCLVQHYLGEMLVVLCLGLFHNPTIAQSVGTLCLTVFTMIGPGLIRSQEGLPEPIKWLSYGMFYKYSSEIMVANEYHQLVFTCEDNDRPNVPLCVAMLCQVFTGDDYLDLMFPGAVANMGRNAAILAGYAVGFWILVYLVFKARGIKHLN